MLTTRNYVFAVLFGLICGGIAYFVLQGENKPAGNVLLESAVITLVGVGGYLYGQYQRAKDSQNKSKAKVSKKQQKRMNKGK